MATPNNRPQAVTTEVIRQIFREEMQATNARLDRLEARYDTQDSRYYPRGEMDKVIDAIREEIRVMQASMRDQRDFVWKALGGAVAVVTILVMFAQHIHIS